MDFESNGLSKEEIRKKRRQKEQMTAMAILGGVILVVLLIIIIIISSVVRSVRTKNEKAKAEAAQKETVAVKEVEEPEPEVSEPEVDAIAGESDVEEAETEEQPEDVAAEEAETESEDDAQSEPEEENPSVKPADLDAQLEEMVTARIESMSVEEKVCQLFFITPEQLMGKESKITAVGSQFNERMNSYPVGGIVLRESNLETADGLSDMISNIRLMDRDQIFIGIMDEGGEDSPLVRSGVTENVIASQAEIGESLGIAGAYSAGISLGGELKQYGFDVNLAPLADVSKIPASVVRDRVFGTDEAQTADLAKNVIKGMKDQGLYTTVKYFPSYGDVSGDGERGPVTSQRTKEDLDKEAEIYKTAIDAGADFLMVSHVGLPKIRGDRRPASLSSEIVTDIIRNEWGYDGIIITDYMDKNCIYQQYTYAEAAVGAIEAGVDVLLATKNFDKSYQAILDAVKKGTITEERIDESLRRIYRVKYSKKLEE